MLSITYDQVEQLSAQSPTFGFYFLRASTQRLFDNIGRSKAGWSGGAFRCESRPKLSYDIAANYQCLASPLENTSSK